VEAPAIESTVRRSRTAAEPPSRSRLLGPERSREHETNSACIQLPETGPEGRIYRQLDAVGAATESGLRCAGLVVGLPKLGARLPRCTIQTALLLCMLAPSAAEGAKHMSSGVPVEDIGELSSGAECRTPSDCTTHGVVGGSPGVVRFEECNGHLIGIDFEHLAAWIGERPPEAYDRKRHYRAAYMAKKEVVERLQAVGWELVDAALDPVDPAELRMGNAVSGSDLMGTAIRVMTQYGLTGFGLNVVLDGYGECIRPI